MKAKHPLQKEYFSWLSRVFIHQSIKTIYENITFRMYTCTCQEINTDMLLFPLKYNMRHISIAKNESGPKSFRPKSFRP